MTIKTDSPLQKTLLLYPVSPLAHHEYSGWRRAAIQGKRVASLFVTESFVEIQFLSIWRELYYFILKTVRLYDKKIENTAKVNSTYTRQVFI